MSHRHTTVQPDPAKGNTPKSNEGNQRPQSARVAMRKAWPLLLACVALLFVSMFGINYVKSIQHSPVNIQISLKTSNFQK